MKTDLLFDFTVDKARSTVIITREFFAEQSLVWEAFTNPEILDQWGAPEPWKTKTKLMDFKVGGRRLYSMTNEEGQEFWSIQEFTSITPISNYKMLTNFSDKDGNVSPQFESSENNVDFSEVNEITTVKITIKYATPAILEMMVEGGFREGITLTLKMLEDLLPTLSR